MAIDGPNPCESKSLFSPQSSHAKLLPGSLAKIMFINLIKFWYTIVKRHIKINVHSGSQLPNFQAIEPGGPLNSLGLLLTEFDYVPHIHICIMRTWCIKYMLPQMHICITQA